MSYLAFIPGTDAKYSRVYAPCLPGEAKVLQVSMESGTTNMHTDDLSGVRLAQSDAGAWHIFR